MAIEIERKFLVLGEPWKGACSIPIQIQQAYFARTSTLGARIRVYGDKGFITLKGTGQITRREFEYEIPQDDAIEMIREFNIEPIIIKTRYGLSHSGRPWVIDVFGGANAGLVVAEVELDQEHQAIDLPTWVGAEVTNDQRFRNSSLARYPYSSWDDDQIFRRH